MLKTPNYLTIGVSEIETTARFFQTMGFVRTSDAEVGSFAGRELYGFTVRSSEAHLMMPGAQHGSLRLIATSEAPAQRGPRESGADSIEIQVRDMERALEILKNARAHIGPVAVYPVHSSLVKECRCDGPDGLALVLIEAEGARSGIMAANPGPMFSEVRAAAWAVRSIDASSLFWKAAGIAPLRGAVLPAPEGGDVVRLRTRQVAAFGDDRGCAIRLDLLEIQAPETREAPVIAVAPLQPGRFLFGFEVEDVALAVRGLPAATYSKTCRIGNAIVVTGVAPGGLGFELRTQVG